VTAVAARSVADSVARFTDASTTPGTARSALSTLATHEAQLIPSIGRRISFSPGAAAAGASAEFCAVMIALSD